MNRTQKPHRKSLTTSWRLNYVAHIKILDFDIHNERRILSKGCNPARSEAVRIQPQQVTEAGVKKGAENVLCGQNSQYQNSGIQGTGRQLSKVV